MAMLAKQGLGQCGTRERGEGKIKVTVAINRNGQKFMRAFGREVAQISSKSFVSKAYKHRR